MNECPCKDCVCKPICRHKGYFAIADCALLKPLFATVFNVENHKAENIVQKQIIIEALNPTTWSISEEGWITVGSRLL